MPELLFNICIISGCWNPMPIEPCGGGVCEYTRMLGFGMPPIFGTTPLIRVACGCCYTYSSMAARQVINTLLLTIGFIAPILLPDVVRVCRAAIDDGIWPCTGCVLIGPTVIWPLPIDGCIVLCGTVALALYRLKTFFINTHLSHWHWWSSWLWCESTLCRWMNDPSRPCTDDWYYIGNDVKLVHITCYGYDCQHVTYSASACFRNCLDWAVCK